MPAVQFYGFNNVIKATEAKGCSVWAIYFVKDLYEKCEEGDLEESIEFLKEVLEPIRQSDAIYKIKFYKSPKGKGREINDKTEADKGSFNFKMVEPDVREAKIAGFNTVENLQLHKKLLETEFELKKLKQYVENPESDSVEGVMVDYLKNPGELGQLINIGRVLLGREPANFGQLGSIKRAAETNTNTETQESVGQSNTTKEQELERLGNAIDVLEKNDPSLVTHLEKLAALAKKDPEEFKKTLALLDYLKT